MQSFQFTRRSMQFVFSMILIGSLGGSPVAAQQANKKFADRLNSYANELMALEMVPGAAMVVVQGDKTVFQAGFGMADIGAKRKVTKDTVFYIASSTKSFTGLAAAICENRRELDLDTTLDKLLPKTNFHQQLDPSNIRFRDLLTHTHGINNNGPVSFRSAYSGQHTDEILKDLMRFHGVAANGKKYRYSNIGYNVAGLAIQNKFGISWKELLKREIFDPLKMNSTTGYVSKIDRNRLAMPYSIEPNGFKRTHYAKSDANMHAAGGLVTTTSDLAQWLKVNINRGKIDGKQLIAEAAFQNAHRSYIKQDSQYMSFSRTGYGLGWQTGSYGKEEMIHHFGGFSGFHCHISFMPKKKIGVAILINTSAGARFADQMARLAYDLLLEKPEVEKQYSKQTIEKLSSQMAKLRKRIKADRDRRAARSQVLPHPKKAYSGTFRNEQFGDVTFKVVNGKLESTMGPLWSAVEVFDGKRNMLRVELTGSGQVVQFDFGDGEQAKSFRLLGLVFERVKK